MKLDFEINTRAKDSVFACVEYLFPSPRFRTAIMSTHIQDSHTFHGISLQVSITVAPENIDKFLAALKPCYDAVTAEPECTFFEVFHDMDNPGHFRFVENWSKSKEWFLKVYSLLQRLITLNLGPVTC